MTTELINTNEQNKKTITIVDAPCGAGKTSYAIQMINREECCSDNDRKFIFITPYLEEVKRIKASCSEQDFHAPIDGKGKMTKSRSLQKLLEEGKNIVATHALFRIINEEALELIKMDNYTLILDEVMDVVDVVGKDIISPHDLQMLFDQKRIKCEEDGTVLATEESEGYSGKFTDLVHKARMNRLVYIDDKLLLWQFPPEIFQIFEEVFVLTYLFDGQIQKTYYDLHGVDYQYRTVKQQEETGDYFLTDFTPDYDRDFKKLLLDNVHIYDGDMNKIGHDYNALSKSWYKRYATGKNKHVVKKAQKALYNYMRNKVKTKSVDSMWTCFRDHEGLLKGKGYGNGFVAHNERATNKYRDRKNLAYMLNKYPTTTITRYFQHKGITLNRDLYAVSEFIQWLLRSQIRDGKPVNLYIPSRRMRSLFTDWLESVPVVAVESDEQREAA